jgi:hypothetical protein
MGVREVIYRHLVESLRETYRGVYCICPVDELFRITVTVLNYPAATDRIEINVHADNVCFQHIIHYLCDEMGGWVWDPYQKRIYEVADPSFSVEQVVNDIPPLLGSVLFPLPADGIKMGPTPCRPAHRQN